MIPLTLAEVAAAVSGELVPGSPQPSPSPSAPSAATPAGAPRAPAPAGPVGAVPVTGAVTVDSRTVSPGDLFVALPGERVDGHAHLGDAAGAGAVAALCSRPDPALPCVVVADPVVALGALAHEVHRRLTAGGLVTVGITGSSGKTSTKDLLGQVLGAAGPTVSPVGSFNNDIGLPLTVLTADAGTRYLVLEMGARGSGHIARLTRVARPRVGVVLNVGSAHLGEFGSADGIAAAKGELVEALPADGTAVLNADDPRVRAMATRTRARVLSTGLAPDAEVRAEDVELDERARGRFTLVTAGERHPVELQVVGAHQVSNALSAAGAALAVGLAPAQVAAALTAAGPRSRWRMEVDVRADGVTVVNDAYNANPESMRAALAALAGLAGRRRVAVLGAMAELGPDAPAEHERLGREAVRGGVDLLVAVGPDAVALHAGAAAEWAQRYGRDPVRGQEEGVVHVPDREGAAALLAGVLEPGDVVLVKASRSYGLELLAAELLAAPPAGSVTA